VSNPSCVSNAIEPESGVEIFSYRFTDYAGQSVASGMIITLFLEAFSLQICRHFRFWHLSNARKVSLKFGMTHKIIFMDMANKKQNEIAMNLTMAVKHLSVRLRAELQAKPEKLNMTQISILFHLHTNGSTTTTALASSEHITQQAISQIVASMKDAGWIKATPDPNDGRKTLLSITRSGEELRESLIDYCDEWVAKTMQAILNEKERAILFEATGLLERLANAKSSTRNA